MGSTTSGKEMKTVWVQNTHSGDIKVVARVPGEGAMFSTRSRVFSRFKTDQLTGRVEHSGYTEIPEEEFNILYRHSSLFKRFITDKKLVRFDEPPLSASTPSEQIIRLSAEMQEVKAQLAREQARSAEKDTEIASLQVRLAESDKELAALWEELEKKPKTAPKPKETPKDAA
jgi:hypothetical protein